MSFHLGFSTTEKLIEKSKLVLNIDSLQKAGIDGSWLTTYANVARRCRDDREFELYYYPYEPGLSMSAFCGGFFEHDKSPSRLVLEKQSSMKPIAVHEAN